jgi:Trk-type K+ transport system membrane component
MGLLKQIHRRLKPNYFRLHLLYFLSLGLVGAIIMFFIEEQEVAFLDCLFMTYSSATQTGLATVDVASLHVASIWVLLVMMTMGNQVLFSSLLPVLVREFYFRRAFHLAKFEDKRVLKQQIEFRALQSMKRITVGLYVVIMTVAFAILGPYCTYVYADLMEERGCSGSWFAWVSMHTAWCNVGFTPLSDSVMAVQGDYVILLTLSTLVMLGNTLYPVALRFTVYFLHRVFPNYDPYKFLLRFPRRCCTHMFPDVHTRMLFACLLIFNLGQYFLMMIFEFHGSLAYLPPMTRSLVCWFQTVVTRTGGFQAVDLSILAPSVQFTMAILMYISSYPMIASLRQMSEESRQYVSMDEVEEEVDQSLAEATIDVKKKSRSFAKQVRTKCMADLWLLSAAIFVMTASESAQISRGQFNIFSLIFETCSAFGTVGASLGYPGIYTSLSTVFHPLGKCAVIFVMIAGRHRGLPRNIDRAVNLTAMSGEAEIAADPEVKEYLQAVALACSALESQKRQGITQPRPRREAPPPPPPPAAVKELSITWDDALSSHTIRPPSGGKADPAAQVTPTGVDNLRGEQDALITLEDASGNGPTGVGEAPDQSADHDSSSWWSPTLQTAPSPVPFASPPPPSDLSPNTDHGYRSVLDHINPFPVLPDHPPDSGLR